MVDPPGVDLHPGLRRVEDLLARAAHLDAEIPVVGEVVDEPAVLELIEDLDATDAVVGVPVHGEALAVGKAAEQREGDRAAAQRPGDGVPQPRPAGEALGGVVVVADADGRLAGLHRAAQLEQPVRVHPAVRVRGHQQEPLVRAGAAALAARAREVHPGAARAGDALLGLGQHVYGQIRMFLGEPARDGHRVIGGVVVDHHDLVLGAVHAALAVERVEHGGQVRGLVVHRQHHAGLRTSAHRGEEEPVQQALGLPFAEVPLPQCVVVLSHPRPFRLVREQLGHLVHEGRRGQIRGAHVQDGRAEALGAVDGVVELVLAGQVRHPGGDGLADRVAVTLVVVGGEEGGHGGVREQVPHGVAGPAGVGVVRPEPPAEHHPVGDVQLGG